MPADMYDDMSFEDDGAMAPEGDDMAMDEAEDIDAEFAMHAAEAGFDTPERQKALKAAIERCYAIKDEAEGEEEVTESNEMDDLESAFSDLG